MRRFLAVLAVLSLLVIPVDAAETTKYVALTFDDGPSGRYTRRLLDGLWEREVKATFLLCGYRIKDYPDITQRIFDEGHEIGYHGYTHKNMKEMSRRPPDRPIRTLPRRKGPLFPMRAMCKGGKRRAPGRFILYGASGEKRISH